MELAPDTGPPRPLKGKAGWLMRPTAFWPALAAAVGAGYLCLTVGLAGRAMVTFLAAAGVGIAVVVGFGLLRWRRRLRALVSLGLTAGRPRTEQLKAAVVEVASFPDWVFGAGVLAWIAGSVAVAMAVLLLERVSWSQAAHIVLVGALVGPITWLLVSLRISMRARRLLEELAEVGGLSSEQVRELLPARRLKLKARVVAFAAISVVTSAGITADAASALVRRSVDRVLSQPEPAAQADLAKEEVGTLFGGMGALCALMAVLAMGIAYAGGTALSDPLGRAAFEAARIAKGEVGKARLIAAEDEVWAVASSFGVMHARLREVLSNVRAAGVRIGATAEQIVRSTSRNEFGATSQAGSLNEVSITTEELARSARQISENASAVAEIASRTLAAAERGRSGAEAFSTSVERMRRDNQAIADSVAKLSKRVQQIGRIVEFINGIADRSDLLALNAELEGTKAGEVGRGFSLVAAEIRRLAENVIESTREIEQLIEEIRHATEAAVAATESGVSATEGGGRLAGSVVASLDTIVGLAQETSDAVRAISLSIQQQQSGTHQLAETMAEILRLTSQSLSATKQAAEANAGLTAVAQDLRSVVERFRIEGA
ncbi:MAG: methyl-accepting chemotaxis protein [Myxococcales bacterium]|nr:methyl-accepting chemotaxis protein [Myxococcales bacterium]